MTTALATAPTQTTAIVSPKDRIRNLIMSRADDIAKIIPKTLTIEKLTQVALIAIAGNDKLMNATPASLLKAVMTAAELGFESFGTLGHCYLVPFDRNVKQGGEWSKITECQLVIGYRGMIDLARRSGQVATIEARIVREGDVFDYEYGTQTRIIHKPAFGGDRRKIMGAYAVAKLRDGSEQVEVMSFDEIEDIRQRSQTGRDIVDRKTGNMTRNEKGPWFTDYSEMARKTVVKRLFKYLPVSIIYRDDDGYDEDQTPPALAPSAREAINAKLLESRPLSEGQSFDPADDVQDQLDRQDADLADAATQAHHEDEHQATGQDVESGAVDIDLTDYSVFYACVEEAAMNAKIEPKAMGEALDRELLKIRKKGKPQETTPDERKAIVERMRAKDYAWGR